MRTIVSILIRDRFGALSRIIELFSSRGYNLDSICSGTCEQPDTQRLTLVISEDRQLAAKIVKLLNGFIDVIEAHIVEAEDSYSCELALLRLDAEKVGKEPLIAQIRQHNAEIVAEKGNILSVQLHGSSVQLDRIIEAWRGENLIVELARTGEAAIHR